MKKLMYVSIIFILFSAIVYSGKGNEKPLPTRFADIRNRILHIYEKDSMISVEKDIKDKDGTKAQSVKVTRDTIIIDMDGKRADFDKLRCGEIAEIWIGDKKLKNWFSFDFSDSYPAATAIIMDKRDKSYGEMPEDFNFVLQYGVRAKNKLDTFGGVFTKDLISAGIKDTKLVLTESEMQEIYEKMMETDIWKYPAVVKTEGAGQPHETFILKFHMDGKVKNITWKEVDPRGNEEAERLWDLVKYITSIIEHRKEYKRLPKAVGGYR